VGCSALPFVVYRANRIVEGSPRSIAEGGPAGWALAAFAVLALVGSFALREPWRSRVGLTCAAGALGALAWALGRAALSLTPDPSSFARVSIGPGAWVAAVGASIVWFAALQSGPSRGWRAGAVALALAAWLSAGLWGGLGRLSIALEYAVQADSFWSALATHLTIAGTSLGIAIAIGLPLGVLSARVGWLRVVVLGVVGVIQTVPSLALLGLLVVPLAALGLPGIGPLPAIIALTLYALLPIVRNTYVGLSAVDPGVVDAGRGMGMSRTQLLLRVEAPLALPLFIEGVRAATVLIIGITAVVAFIGVGTLGVLVFLGWGEQADDLTLLGAVPMVVLAVAADALLRAAGRLATSPGIRMEAAP
jgi:osmoprotectant transport system permease protein